MTTPLSLISGLRLVAGSICLGASLCLARQDLKTLSTEGRTELVAFSAALLFFGLGLTRARLVIFSANLGLWALGLLLTLGLERRLKRCLIGGADFRYLLTLALIAPSVSAFYLLLPLACLFALPHALWHLSRGRRQAPIPLIPYLLLSVILLIISEGI